MRASKFGAIVAGLSLVLAACGSGTSESSESAPDEKPATEESSSGASEAAEDESSEPAGDESSAEPVEISLLVPTYSDNTKSIWEGLIADFQEANPNITVKLEIQSWDNINDVIRTKIQGNDAPDILNVDAFASFAADGLLYPVEEIVSPETIADIQDSFADNASVDGVMYGLPLIASARTVFYNTDLFEQAGVTAPPKTWDELLEAAKAISALGGDIYGYGMPLGNEEAQAETSVWVFGAGGVWTDGTKVTVDTPEALEAAQFMARMVGEGATQPDAGATDRTPLMNVFIQGKIGMMVGLPPVIGQIAERNPDLNYGMAPIATKDGSAVTLGVADHLMAFNNGTDKGEAIGAFLDFFYTTENYLKFADGEGFLPTTKSGAEATANAEKFAAFLEVLPGARFYPSTNAQWPIAQAGLQNQIGRIAQGDDPAAVLAEIQERVDAG
ncbi:MAG: sugar ABC transporter substrate-binding protein [Ilumatobacter coccineus]|uniref:Sugar ABC transporter substrate-binding protein n=1 Tax=Ilumatobacter coccineus TaxID=467094 RepID=A0A2G6K9N6_9ACTN|nr:MAG: sugar ABC transporter substrate-binding protein [Ilumatobacter coccineus]